MIHNKTSEENEKEKRKRSCFLLFFLLGVLMFYKLPVSPPQMIKST